MSLENPLLKVNGVSKSFAGIEVLSDVDFELRRGEVHAIVGENGAGKSTFIKILSGVYQRDRGRIEVEGSPIGELTPRIAHDFGIVTIYQERNLIPDLTVGENILIGSEPRNSFGIVQWKTLFSKAERILKDLNLDVEPKLVVKKLSSAEQQAVEIAKALYKKAKIVIMDEPTASLTRAEIDNLFKIIAKLKKSGVGIIYISHRLDEIFRIADRVTVFRDGKMVLQKGIKEINKDILVKAMVGEELLITRIDRENFKEIVFEVEDLTRKGIFENISFKVSRGEILAIAGTVGSGRSELLRVIAGVESPDSGKIMFMGEEVQGFPMEELIKKGVCYIPAERDLYGLISSMSVSGNITIANLSGISRGPLLILSEERDIAGYFIRVLNIQTRDHRQEVKYLSGGNRQKVMVAKWLYKGIEVFIMDEPTQGVDVGAREEIHRIMKKLVEEGKCIIMVTSDMDELMNMSHRILVMSNGRMVAELITKQTTREEVLSFALGKSSKQR
ncbi:MAG: D-xylose ABC transporter ATP-binding protein [Spirochaetes bacterium]|nr:MAG: D-xylose ABC transporter ATP-binding protein [Spirochaetota bacterium]